MEKLSAEDINTIKQIIVDPLSKQIERIHSTPCDALLAVSKKVDKTIKWQIFIYGVFSALLFILTFFKEFILGIIKR